jgi:lysophospholipase L1-like esterase
MKRYKWLILFLIVIPALGACSYHFPEESPPSAGDLGTVNVESVVAIGDDYMAGVMDGALYSSGQNNSIPAIIAKQMNQIVPFNFVQPEICSENGFNLLVGNEAEIYGKWKYVFEDKTSDFPKRKLTVGEMPGELEVDRKPIRNFSVPELKIQQVFNPGLSANLYYLRMASAAGSSTLLSDLKAADPTFTLVWIGMNDYLHYAIKGATNEIKQQSSGSPDRSLTPVDEFSTAYRFLTDRLLQHPDNKLAIGNLISLQSLPYFYCMPYNKLFLTNEQLSAVRSVYQEFNQAVVEYNRTVPAEKQRPFIDFYDNGWNLHPQPLVVIDSLLPDAAYPNDTPLEKYRQLNENELVLLSLTDEMVEAGYGSAIPLPNEFFLTERELSEVEMRTNSFNAVISELAAIHPERIVLVDVNGLVEEIAEAGKTDAHGDRLSNTLFYFNGVPVEGALEMNSIFSLDGLHFNQRGNAFVANEFIDAINKKFGAQISKADINRYPGNVYNFSY